MDLTWETALAWRARRQLLDPVGTGSVADVVGRLGAVPAWPDPAAELAIGARRAGARLGDAARALADGQVVKVFAFRGALHLMTPHGAGAFLALRASSRMWELPSWQSFYRLAPSDWPQFREHVRDLLADGPLTRAELAAALRRNRRYRHLGTVIEDGNDTLLKPLSWQGDVGLGPPRDGEPTLLRLDSVAGWRGVPPLDEAGATVLTHYFRTYGPAPADRVFDWFGKGLGVKRRTLVRWLDDLAPRLEPVDVEGDRVLVLAEDLAELRAARISTALRLLPARDVWVMAPGSSDERVVPAAHRDVVSRFSNLVVWRGRVGGTWSLRGEALEVTWFPESGTLPSTELSEQAEVLGQLLDRSLAVRVQAG